jgi:proton-dependent oligopeptide transporter, POT family
MTNPGRLQACDDVSRKGEYLGHPAGLTFLFATEMWERFSYYGMRALLVLYMVDYLLRPGRADDVLGLGALRDLLEAMSGPLGVQPLASRIYGLYSGFVYLTPVLGGLLADRWLGRRRTVAIGALLMVAGHFLMASERYFLFALLLLILGNGAFKPNIVTQVGGLYGPGDARRDRAYSIFYVGINIGAFFSPLVCGTLGETLGWHYGFASAGIGMLIGLVIYLFGLSRLPVDAIKEAHQPKSREASLGRSALLGLALLFMPSALFWAAYEQQGNTIALWAEHATDRSINLVFWRGEIPVTWFQAFNPLMIFLFTPLLVGWWARRARSSREPATVAKLITGCLGLSLGYLVLAAGAWATGGSDASWLWLLAYFVIITIAELYFSPIGLSLVASMAPDGSRSLVMGVWMMTSFVGNFAAGWLGGYWSSLSSHNFFLLVAAIAALAGAMLGAARRPLQALIAEKPSGAGGLQL